jgi:simple sugar transport system ATP-binding protein
MDVQFQHISKNFASLKALTDVSLRAVSGTIHGLIGENGAGKSTLMKILTGYQSKSSGKILIDGREVELNDPGQASALGIGMLYQEPMDFPPLTVLENFSLGSPQRSREELNSAFHALSIRFGFHLAPHRLVECLTVGERQQIELLRLIHCNIKVLILDEPTTGISPAQKQALFPALRHLAADGMTILLVSHKLEEVASLCSEVTVLRHGECSYHTTAPFQFQKLLTAMFGCVPKRKDKSEARETGAPVLVFKDIEASGERQGLQHCDISVAEGEVIGLAGLDGAGQSTFLRLAAGLTHPDQGEVQLFGTLLPRSGKACIRAQKLHSSFIPADRLEEALFAEISLQDHFSLREEHGQFWRSCHTTRKRAQEAIAAFSIKGTPDELAEDLSGGNQQRLLLSLLDSKSRLILLENPSRGLDIQSGQWIWQYLREELCPDTSIIFSSPELEEILHYSDRVLVFHDGKIVLDSAVKDTSHDLIAAAMTGMTASVQ